MIASSFGISGDSSKFPNFSFSMSGISSVSSLVVLVTFHPSSEGNWVVMSLAHVGEPPVGLQDGLERDLQKMELGEL